MPIGARFQTDIRVEWDQDVVPGWNNGIEDFQRMLMKCINERIGMIPHYKPTARITANAVIIDGDAVQVHVAKEFLGSPGEELAKTEGDRP